MAKFTRHDPRNKKQNKEKKASIFKGERGKVKEFDEYKAHKQIKDNQVWLLTDNDVDELVNIIESVDKKYSL